METVRKGNESLELCFSNVASCEPAERNSSRECRSYPIRRERRAAGKDNALSSWSLPQGLSFHFQLVLNGHICVPIFIWQKMDEYIKS